jgi:hypothetical protein
MCIGACSIPHESKAQETLNSFILSSKMGSLQQENCNSALLNFVVGANVLFNQIDTPSFKAFCKELNPSFVSPGRTKMTSLLHTRFEKSFEAIQEQAQRYR